MSSAHFLEMIIAVVVTSTLGSLHCVGMCGPFALMVTSGTISRKQTLFRLTLYHLGRLTTYAFAGAMIGIAGLLITSSGQLLGIQMAAAKLAGIGLLLIGFTKLLAFINPKIVTVLRMYSLSRVISNLLGAFRTRLKAFNADVRAFSAGALTTLLPCGWLYLFLLVAGGTGSVKASLTFMFAFWVGTLPAITGLVFGGRQLATRFHKLMPLAGSTLLIAVGVYTIFGRASTDLSRLNHVSHDFGDVVAPADRQTKVIKQVVLISKEPLPCCKFHSPKGH